MPEHRFRNILTSDIRDKRIFLVGNEDDSKFLRAELESMGARVTYPESCRVNASGLIAGKATAIGEEINTAPLLPDMVVMYHPGIKLAPAPFHEEPAMILARAIKAKNIPVLVADGATQDLFTSNDRRHMEECNVGYECLDVHRTDRDIAVCIRDRLSGHAGPEGHQH